MAQAHPHGGAHQISKQPNKLAGYNRSSYVVWELTLKCNLACKHCGSRAGRARPDELTTEEAKDVIAQLADLGFGEITISGGEPLLRDDWPELVQAINDHGMLCTVVSAGFDIPLEKAQLMKEVGVAAISISVDGLEQTHQQLRVRRGSWQACFDSMRNFREAGLPFGCNTQLNRLTAPELPRLYEHLKEAGVSAWQLQYTVPMGAAADYTNMMLQPAEIPDVFDVMARVVKRAQAEKVNVLPADCIGYYTPYDPILRAGTGTGSTWLGCQAGLHIIGIEADGAVKGCLSLPTRDYIGGNVRQQRLAEIVDNPALKLNFGCGTPEGTAHLWGFCAECEYAELCRAGCSNAAHVFFGRRGNNPYCYHRAATLAERGLRERLVLTQKAEVEPFGVGLFEIIEESLDAPWPEDDPNHFTPEKVTWPSGDAAWPKVALGDRTKISVTQYGAQTSR